MSEAPENPSETNPQPDVRDTERIVDPSRLAEIVLNTVDTTLNPNLFQVDQAEFTKFMQTPSRHEADILSTIAQVAENATTINLQLDSVNQVLEVVSTHPEESLPISQIGTPPRTVADLNRVEQLLAVKKAQREEEGERRRNEMSGWTDEQRMEQSNRDQANDAAEKEAVLQDPVRRLARLIRSFNQDGITTPLIMTVGYGELILKGGDRHASSRDLFAQQAIEGMQESQRNANLQKIALQQFAQGNIPDEATVRKVLLGGTNAIPAYLKTFAPPTTPQPKP